MESLVLSGKRLPKTHHAAVADMRQFFYGVVFGAACTGLQTDNYHMKFTDRHMITRSKRLLVAALCLVVNDCIE